MAKVGEGETEEQDNKREKQKIKKIIHLIGSWIIILGWKDLGLPGFSCSEQGSLL